MSVEYKSAACSLAYWYGHFHLFVISDELGVTADEGTREMINYIPSKGVCHKSWVWAELCVLSLSWRSRTCHSVCFALLKRHIDKRSLASTWQRQNTRFCSDSGLDGLLWTCHWSPPSQLWPCTEWFSLVPSPKAPPSTSITTKRWKWPCQNG